ncbi:MAG: hypothetical protein SWJ54_06795, partial [Cyanobacteriota bacterium]|nr:hypothetical protein [Cyanobacteriota bacterium]
WMLLAACGSFYVAGEEISWGQHIVGWESGDFWKTINDQEETNLHNTSSWLDQKPRLLLELAVIFGGIFIPLAHRSGKSLPFFLSLVAPPFRLLPLAVIVAGLKVSDKTLDTLDLNFFTRVSEVIELYLFYYILLYLADLICKRMASRGKTEIKQKNRNIW